MDKALALKAYVMANPQAISNIVDFNAETDRLYHFDLTAANTALDADTFSDTLKFSDWVTSQLNDNNCRYGIGGYMENRVIYARSQHFDTLDEPRRLHLGVDIWAGAGTPVYTPLKAIVHSFKDNNNFGDYGPTIILEHHLPGFKLYTLYGHLNRRSLDGLYEGKPISAGQQIASFGESYENGSWPPHLHFQLMFDMQGKKGDYPGVCRYSEKELYQKNIPDPALLLGFEV